jgi:hypothetical protein
MSKRMRWAIACPISSDSSSITLTTTPRTSPLPYLILFISHLLILIVLLSPISLTMATSPLYLPGTFPKSPQSELSVDSDISISHPQDDTVTYSEKDFPLKNLDKGKSPVELVPRKRTRKEYFPKFVQIVMILVCTACIIGIKMMPAKYMVIHLFSI